MLDSIPICRACALGDFLTELRGMGVPVDAALRRARLPVSLEETPDSWVPYVNVRRFLADVARREGIMDLGARTGRRNGWTRGLAPQLLAMPGSGPTLFHALNNIRRVVALQSTHLRVWLEPNGGFVRVCHANVVGPEIEGYEIIDDNATIRLVQLVRLYCGPSWLPVRVLCRSTPGARTRTPDMAPFGDSGVEVELTATCGGFDILRDDLWTVKLSPAPASAPDATTEPPRTVSDALLACLAPYMCDRPPSIEVAAEIAGSSVRALQRALEREGTHFSRVLERARLEAATRAIEGGEISLAELALRLGYSEQSAFTRAFRRWTGLSPRAWRKRTRPALN